MKNPKDKNTNINSKKKKKCRLIVGATKLGVEGYMILTRRVALLPEAIVL